MDEGRKEERNKRLRRRLRGWKEEAGEANLTGPSRKTESLVYRLIQKPSAKLSGKRDFGLAAGTQNWSRRGAALLVVVGQCGGCDVMRCDEQGESRIARQAKKRQGVERVAFWEDAREKVCDLRLIRDLKA